MAVLFTIEFDIVILLEEIEKVNPEIEASLIYTDVTVGELLAKLYYTGNYMTMEDPAGTGCELYGVGLRLIS